MRDLKNIPNISPVSSDYPHGAIKNTSGADVGTPIIAEVYGDIVQNAWRAMDVAGVSANGIPDNMSNGFQLLRAYERLFSDKIGKVIMFPYANYDDTYQLLDGSELSCDAYPDLFAVLGFRYGGNLSTTFRVPNANGRVMRGYTGADLGGNDISYFNIEIGNLPEHNHGFFAGGVSGSFTTPHYTTNTDSTVACYTQPGGGVANPAPVGVDIVPSYLGMYFFIKAKYRF